MRLAVLSVALLLGACVTPMAPPHMSQNRPMRGEINAAADDDSDVLDESIDRARAAASRPGDEALNCAQLEQETTAIALDPAMQRLMQRMGGGSQAVLAEIKKKQQEQMMGIAASLSLSLIGQLTEQSPVANLLTTGAQDVLSHRTEKQQAAQEADMNKQVAEIQSVMPLMMRSQRVRQLGQAKNCAFLKPSPT